MISKKLLFNAHNDANLLEWDPDNTFNRNPKDLETGLTKLFTRMSELQYRMYVEKKTSLLIILQGMDTSGKDGTIRHVITAFHPVSCRVETFKIPSTEDLAHDYLWRIHKVVPKEDLLGYLIAHTMKMLLKFESKIWYLKQFGHNDTIKLISSNGIWLKIM